MHTQFIFISGGCVMYGNFGLTSIATVERYDSLKNLWESLPDLTEARQDHSSCIIGNTMYALGGITAQLGQYSNSIELLEDIDT